MFVRRSTFSSVLLLACLMTGFFGIRAAAQTFSVLHMFNGGGHDGALPYSGVTLDAAGNLYGTTYYGGNEGWGVVYKLARTGDHWAVTVINDFAASGGGNAPIGGVVFGANGTLYGTTTGHVYCEMGCGAVFSLRPASSSGRTPAAPWVLTPIHYFTGGPDGGVPLYGNLAVDASGNIFGTTSTGGTNSAGVVFQFEPAGQGYTENVIQNFTGDNGYFPYGSVLADPDGNLYTTASAGGANGGGAVIEITPSGGGWIGNVIYSFAASNDGWNPKAGLTRDRAGNLYGTTYSGDYPDYSNGVVFELTRSNGHWQETILKAFPYVPQQPPSGPISPVVLDSAGNLYGTTNGGGAFGWGTVFELSPSAGGWTYRDLHDFSGADGTNPYGALAIDGNGNLYGTTSLGGTSCNCGTIWELQTH